ncbi:MAG: hypothetical protein WBP67_13540 [Thermoanaerobaculia bacterium]
MLTRKGVVGCPIGYLLALAGTAMAQEEDATADTQVRFQISFLFPTKKK